MNATCVALLLVGAYGQVVSDPSTVPPTQRPDVQAQDWLARGEFDVAMLCYDRAIEQDRRNPNLYLARGRARLEHRRDSQDEMFQALADFGKVEILSRQELGLPYHEALYLRGCVWTHQIQIVKRASEETSNVQQGESFSAPADVEARLLKYFQFGLAEFNKALSFSRSPRYYQGRAELRTELVGIDETQRDKAQKDRKAADELDPDNEEAGSISLD